MEGHKGQNSSTWANMLLSHDLRYKNVPWWNNACAGPLRDLVSNGKDLADIWRTKIYLHTVMRQSVHMAWNVPYRWTEDSARAHFLLCGISRGRPLYCWICASLSIERYWKCHYSEALQHTKGSRLGFARVCMHASPLAGFRERGERVKSE